MTLQPVSEPVVPVIVRVVSEPTPELGVVDVLVQALGLTGVLLLGSALFGFILGVVFIWYRHYRTPYDGEGGATRYGFDLSSPR